VRDDRGDPEFGNPYNDIAPPSRWDATTRPSRLEKAKRAPRYEAPHYPRFNLGRVFVAKERYSRALAEFAEALELQPDYPPPPRDRRAPPQAELRRDFSAACSS
jgi:Tfp pilus assembly protein PilF